MSLNPTRIEFPPGFLDELKKAVIFDLDAWFENEFVYLIELTDEYNVPYDDARRMIQHWIRRL